MKTFFWCFSISLVISVVANIDEQSKLEVE